MLKAVIDSVPPKIRVGAQVAVLRAVLALPYSVRRQLAGKPVRLDGQELDLNVQLVLRLQRLSGKKGLTAATAEKARLAMQEAHKMLVRTPLAGVEVSDVRIPSAGSELAGRLYRPSDLSGPSKLMIFYHGGGWVIGDLDSHDDLCRYLAKHAGIRVLAVDYRLAPEAPFPAAVEDAIATFQYAVDNAESLGTSADSISVGGDSAGANLATVVAQNTAKSATTSPMFQFLLYPATDATVRRPSRDLFAKELLLTDEDIDWFIDHYCPDVPTRKDPRISVLLADDLGSLPPAYIVTAGFDPLRDEGEAYAAKLEKAGVEVTLRRFPELVHGFANMRQLGGRFEESLEEIADNVRAKLGQRV